MLLLALAASLDACDESAPPPIATEEDNWTPMDSGEVLWIGCDATVNAGQCEIDDGPITVWVPGGAQGLHFALAGRPLAPTSRTPTHDVGHDAARVDGTRFVVPVRVDRGQRVELELRDQDDRVVWALGLRSYALARARSEYQDQLSQARAATSADERHQLGQALIDGLQRQPPMQRLARLSDARRLSFDGTDFKTSFDRMAPLLGRVADTAASLDRWGEQCQAASISLYFADFNANAKAAERWLPLEQPCRKRAPRWGIEFDFFVGALALNRGDYETAAFRFARARKQGLRLGLQQGAEASLMYVTLLCRMARWTEATRELESLEHQTLDPCTRALSDSWIGYLRLRARRRDHDLGDPRPALLRALQLHKPGAACERVSLRDYDVLKLGLAAALRGDLQETRQRLAALDPDQLTGKFPPQYEELRAHAALLAGDRMAAGEAATAMARSLARSPDANSQGEVWWRVVMLEAAVAEAAGDSVAAIEAYRRAEAVLDGFREDVESGAARDRWLTGFRKSALRLVEHLVESGQLEDAACAARTARVRALVLQDTVASELVGQHDAREQCERPWSRRPGELVMFFVPRLDGTWRVFEILDNVVRSTRVVSALPTTAEDDGGWWDPWSDALRTVDMVRVLASEAAFAVPFHALDWEGTPLASRRAVVYGLDLPALGHSPTRARSAQVAFADADPLRTLDRYEPDVARVARTLSQQGWDVRYETAETDRQRLVQVLPSVSLLHYYGHGQRNPLVSGAGPLPPQDVGTTALLLVDGTQLDVDDVLDLPAVPRWVVLLGCEVGFPDVQGWSGGLNLAHAFLLAGATQVIASTEPLDAAAAAALGPQLYAPSEASGTAMDLSVRLQRAWASHALDETTPPPWHALRVWSR